MCVCVCVGGGGEGDEGAGFKTFERIFLFIVRVFAEFLRMYV